MIISSRSRFVVGIMALSLIASACGGGPTGPDSTSARFQGIWEGTWQRTSCAETGGAVGVACNQTPSSGSLRLTLTQTGTSVQGSVEVASFLIAVSGTMNASGTLTLNGTAHLQNATETLSNWSTSRTGNTMTGAFTLAIVADNQLFGSQTIVLTLQNVNKTS